MTDLVFKGQNGQVLTNIWWLRSSEKDMPM